MESRGGGSSGPSPSAAVDGSSVSAVLVIHGIGEQAPYQTLDAFVQGVAVEFGIGPKQLEHRLIASPVGTLSFIRMPLPRSTKRGGARTLDFYEFHWAGMVEGRIGLRQVLGWLARTALNPLRLWAQQAIVLGEVADRKNEPHPNFLPSFLKEVGRSVLILLVAAAVIAPFLYAFSHLDQAKGAWTILRAAIGSGRDVAVLSGLLLTALVIVATARGGFALIRRWRKGAGTERKSVDRWARASIITAVVLAVAAFLANWAFDLQGGRILLAVGRALLEPAVLGPLLSAGAAAFLGKILVDYLGDVALYTTADENSAYYRTRAAILKRSTELVRHLCEEGDYGGVYLAGHSLGSVIAYDTIDKYIRDTRAAVAPRGPGLGVERLRGLLTFGSPLDAVYFFFRTEVGPDEPVRAQILSSLHGFRRRASGRDYGPFKFADYEVLKLEQCRWLNVYSRTDLISRHLVFYEVDEQVARIYPWSPIRSHLAYWHDPGFYKLVESWL